MRTDLFKSINKALKIVGGTINKYSPEILIGCGICGFISTAILVSKEAPVVRDRLDDLHEELAERDEDLTKGQIIFEEIKVSAPIYAPAIVSGVVSTACILGSYKIKSNRTAAIAAAYELTQASLTDYKAKVEETFGEKKAKKVINDIEQDKVSKTPIPAEMLCGSDVVMTDGLSLFYDEYGGRYFRSSVDIVRKAEKVIADRLITEMWVPLNDLYFEMGLDSTKLGDDVGFNVSRGIEISFGSVLAPNMTPCTVVEYMCGPRTDYNHYADF